MQNRTKMDAFRRVSEGRTGCLVDTTPEFLMHLRVFVARWLEDIDMAIASMPAECQCAVADGLEWRHEDDCPAKVTG